MKYFFLFCLLFLLLFLVSCARNGIDSVGISNAQKACDTSGGVRVMYASVNSKNPTVTCNNGNDVYINISN
jgi:hypothetical protein